MVRIKGENSDYKYFAETGQIQAVEPKPEQLYLQIFVCPYDHPSRVEVHDDEGECCTGTNHHCPEARSGEVAKGHALIRLDEKTGISLVAGDRNQIIIDQTGKILLCPTTDGQVEIHGSLIVRHPNGQTIQLDVCDRGITLETTSGSQIHLDPLGNINLSPGKTGKVHINGDLEVHGTIHTPPTPTPSTIQSLIA